MPVNNSISTDLLVSSPNDVSLTKILLSSTQVDPDYNVSATYTVETVQPEKIINDGWLNYVDASATIMAAIIAAIISWIGFLLNQRLVKQQICEKQVWDLVQTLTNRVDEIVGESIDYWTSSGNQGARKLTTRLDDLTPLLKALQSRIPVQGNFGNTYIALKQAVTLDNNFYDPNRSALAQDHLRLSEISAKAIDLKDVLLQQLPK